jgi:hypothetical protein
VRITGGGEGGTSGANGVYCGRSVAGISSRCAVLGNLLIEGSSFGYPPTAVGVRCDDGGCLRIEDNVITGRGGIDSWGVYLGATGTYVDDNAIDGGCSTGSATGLYAENSWARVQNNRILGGSCPPGGVSAARSVGVDVRIADGGNELDLHSNSISGLGGPGTCTSIGISLDLAATAPATSGVGIFRNNIVRAGVCSTATVFSEAVAGADPRVFENNDLDPTGSPAALYFDEGATPLTAYADVNTRTDMTTADNISADPLFVAYPADLHIGTGSPCDAAGTTAGAPSTDMDGAARSATDPDIGADEI